MMNLDQANFETNELLSARGLNRFVFMFFLFFVFHLSISSIRQDSLIDDTHTHDMISDLANGVPCAQFLPKSSTLRQRIFGFIAGVSKKAVETFTNSRRSYSKLSTSIY